MGTPPPLPRIRGKKQPTPLHVPLVAFLGISVAVLFSLLIVLRIFGLVRPFRVAADSMAPALSTGDHFMAEGITFHLRNPHRGEIVAFRTDGLGFVNASIQVKRVIGQPGERVSISNGNLYINGAPVVISNAYGPVRYQPPRSVAADHNEEMLVPSGQYFILGDNSTNSFDSRFFGCLPATNIIGRAWLCYWPPSRIGLVK